jgi:dTDP-4-dehydrorhamnose 3,5-epimerase
LAELDVRETVIPGLLVVDLPVHADDRGWFKENWQRHKMVALGLPDFGPVQNNMSYNTAAGATRGIHAEPWDKLVSVAHGRVFGAWVDLRQGPRFGTLFSMELGPETAVYVPRGVGNAFQTLVNDTVYSYLVNDHWSVETRDRYTYVNLGDDTLAIQWPIPLDRANLSEADRKQPALSDVTPLSPPKTLIIGADGQVGRALRTVFTDADAVALHQLDLSDPASFGNLRWRDYDTIVNAAAYTAVDTAETPEGRRTAWMVNVSGVGRLAEITRQLGATLVHISSDYVFDGSATMHLEDEPFSPLGVYGQTKAAGDALVATTPRHYVVRASWVVGDGENFVRTMIRLADQGVEPDVVDDQYGRMTFATDLAEGIAHLIQSEAPHGTYNLTGSGAPMSWADIAREVFAFRGRPTSAVHGVSTAQYSHGRTVSPRPRNSVLNLSKITSTGFTPTDHRVGLRNHLNQCAC